MPSPEDLQTRKIRSGVFTLPDGSAYMLELRPKHHVEFQAKLVIHAIRTPREAAAGSMRRKLLCKPSILKLFDPNGPLNQVTSFEKDLEEIFFVDPPTGDDQVSKLEHTVTKFISFSHKSALETN